KPIALPTKNRKLFQKPIGLTLGMTKHASQARIFHFKGFSCENGELVKKLDFVPFERPEMI
ncbi:MAG: hypothetical protein IJ274_06865, partial [Lachnospiraceae bacterium]|nr:hypothetical protein [Lachnospiraceae bacterium]